MTGDGAREEEPVRVGKLLRVAVRRGQHQHGEISLRDPDAAKIDVRGGPPEDPANNSGVAQQLLNRPRHQIRMGAQARELSRVPD